MFKVGDKVVCVNDDCGEKIYITRGAVYTVSGLSDCGEYCSVHGAPASYYKDRFVKIDKFKGNKHATAS